MIRDMLELFDNDPVGLFLFSLVMVLGFMEVMGQVLMKVYG